MNQQGVFKCGMAIVLGFITSFWHQYGMLSALVCAAICFDIATGLVSARIRCAISSRHSFRGLLRKVALLMALAFGFFLDAFTLYLLSAQYMAGVLPTSIPFGHMVGIYIILNESLSVCENLYSCGVKLPAAVIEALRLSGQKIDIKKED